MTAPGRSVSGVEWVWLAADRIAPPFANQFVIEGRGDGVSPEDVARAAAEVAAVQPGSRVRLKGQIWTTDGPVPRVRPGDGSEWDGRSPVGAPFLLDPLPPQSLTCEVLVVRGDPWRVVVRTHHAAMDGQGTLLFAEGLFAALRGETPAGAEAGPTTDAALAATTGRTPDRPPPIDCPAPVRGACGGASRGTTWRRIRVPGRPRGMLAALALATAQAAGGPCRVDVPVDLRRLQPDLRSSANLTGIIRLPVRPEEEPEALTARLKQGLEVNLAADFVLAASPLRRLPLGLLAAGGRSKAARNLTLARYGTTATLSNLGRLDLARFSAPGFDASAGFFIPPGSPGLPLFVACSGDDEGVEICATMPAALASHGRIEGLLERLAAAVRAIA
ncbi:MAG: hypothetical protein GY898_24855 [Proteobacteria bacterium]|nr:hypothetical protein [Pseudomonadota bacterium]